MTGLAGVLLMQAPAAAYGIKLHGLFPRHTFQNLPSRPLATAKGDLEKFRLMVYDQLKNHPDPQLRDRFLKYYPKPFTAWSFKEFLMLNPAKDVWGIDRPPGTLTPIELLSKGSVDPDTDVRNQDRLLRDEKGQPVKGKSGTYLPDDPMTLKMGSLEGLSSQAHAHYQLPKGPLSSNPLTLFNDPRHFATPANVETYGADFVQAYTTLAQFARQKGFHSLSWLYGGNALHHLGDIGNPIHTVQVGLSDFFLAAWGEVIKDQISSLFGLLRPAATFLPVGIQILTNHHMLCEQLFDHRLEATLAGTEVDPGVQAALKALSASNDALPASDMPIAELLVEEASKDGAALYAATKRMAVPKLSQLGGKYDHDVPEDYLRPRDAAFDAAEKAYNQLLETAFGRIGTAFRRWLKGFEAGDPDWDTFLKRRLDYLDRKTERQQTLQK